MFYRTRNHICQEVTSISGDRTFPVGQSFPRETRTEASAQGATRRDETGPPLPGITRLRQVRESSCLGSPSRRQPGKGDAGAKVIVELPESQSLRTGEILEVCFVARWIINSALAETGNLARSSKNARRRKRGSGGKALDTGESLAIERDAGIVASAYFHARRI